MKAEPDAQRRLLDLQAIDTTLAQLAHRRRTLPEHAQVQQLAHEIEVCDEERVRAQVGVDDLDRDIARIERDVEQVRARKARDQARLDGGSGPARELEALQHELASLQRRQAELEDAQLELMEQREQAQATLTEAERRLAELREKQHEAQVRRDQAIDEIDRDVAVRTKERERLAAELPGDLLDLYELIRAQSGGIGAALLRAGRCEGCRLELAGSELAKVRAAPPDEIVRCDECRRILVRTAESGL